MLIICPPCFNSYIVVCILIINISVQNSLWKSADLTLRSVLRSELFFVLKIVLKILIQNFYWKSADLTNLTGLLFS